MGQEKDNHIFHILGGPTYSEKTRPQFWHNKTRLVLANPLAIKQLPLDQFPLIENFQVLLEKMTNSQEQSIFGYHVTFYSPYRGYIARFPWWDNAEKDLRREDFSIPLGSFKKPFVDLEQGWKIVIAEHEGYIYVLQGIGRQWYDAWFKVSRHLYASKWQEAIQLCRRMGNK